MEEGPSGSRVRFAPGKGHRTVDTIVNNVDILNEIFRYLDATSLGRAACVSRKWKQATDEETLWEAICTRHWPATSTSSSSQLKSVVVALGGFKRLYANWLHPLLSRNSNGGGFAYKRPLFSRPLPNKWSKDEIYLSLSLFSIDRYERIAPPSAAHRHPAAAEVRRLLDGWRGKCTADQPSKVDLDSDNDVNSL